MAAAEEEAEGALLAIEQGIGLIGVCRGGSPHMEGAGKGGTARAGMLADQRGGREKLCLQREEAQ